MVLIIQREVFIKVILETFGCLLFRGNVRLGVNGKQSIDIEDGNFTRLKEDGFRNGRTQGFSLGA